MTFTDTIVFIGEHVGNISNRHNNKIQNKKIWKSLRTHIMSRRKKNKQGTFEIWYRYILTYNVLSIS